jgi:serine protease Do
LHKLHHHKISHKISHNFVFFIGLLLISSLSSAQVYKYKDENGRWRFTDKKPMSSASELEQFGSEKNVTNPTEQADANTNNDMAEVLRKQYNPTTTIENATLAVVKITTSIALGSGFFISDTGYIVTNKHVIRPEESEKWNAYKREKTAHIENITSHLEREKYRVIDMEDYVRRAKQEIDSPGRYRDPISPEQYYSYELRYKTAKKEFEKSKKEQKRLISDYKLETAEHELRQIGANNATSFQITFKNGNQADAEFIALSDSEDLALLKLNGYKTPYLKFEATTRHVQGQQVYAIGNPLGQSDTMTSGIITKITNKSIYTDADIFPGNSGGPLIDAFGNLIGVNTQKLSYSSDGLSSGLGVTIPINTVISEFSNLIKE